MFKICIFVALLTISIHAHHPPPTAEEIKAELVAAGVSETAAQGLSDITLKHKEEFENAKQDREAGKKVFEAVKTEAEAFIATQPEADQTAYAAFIAKKKEEFKNHKHPEASQ